VNGCSITCGIDGRLAIRHLLYIKAASLTVDSPKSSQESRSHHLSALHCDFFPIPTVLQSTTSCAGLGKQDSCFGRHIAGDDGR